VRKDRMLALSDAFLVLPGGLGTLDELFEVLTLRQIGYHAKPTALVSAGGYYESLMRTLRALAVSKTLLASSSTRKCAV
jgi:uncharacterized protein (TIGR00730 family)